VRTRGDRDRLAQVFSNLVGNALEHGDPSQPVTLDIRVTGGDVTVTVHNHGAPISDDRLADLFEPFRGRLIRSERSRGLGLGLYITEQIIRAHDGRIEVASTPERGTTFTVVLPRADGEAVDSVQQQAVS
jgi:signal transduction histidine kinase